ncbi:MAG: flavodoxin-dependent (E)-4-hydroxy-3-methylbut-2-enyl-diphosphate synthase [Planctomycetes bacterium]|nr:flavodoxin-dependent (E)-4-hydroxy-3-methylbut-2-enyl-diphosphate synthase [Planctomycetota bacterium]
MVRIGGDAPVAVQTMTAGYTHDIDKCVAEIDKLVAAGAQLVRVAVPERKDTKALPEILRQTSIPIVASTRTSSSSATSRKCSSGTCASCAMAEARGSSIPICSASSMARIASSKRCRFRALSPR